MSNEDKSATQQVSHAQTNGITPGLNNGNKGMKLVAKGLYKYDTQLLGRNLNEEEKRHNSFVNKQIALEKEEKRQQKKISATSSKRVKGLINSKMESSATQLRDLKGYATFCLGAEGGDIYLRLSVSKVINLRTLKVEDASHGDVFLCYLDDLELVKESASESK